MTRKSSKQPHLTNAFQDAKDESFDVEEMKKAILEMEEKEKADEEEKRRLAKLVRFFLLCFQGPVYISLLF